MPIPSFGDPAGSLILARLIHHGINSGISNELFIRWKISDRTEFGQECRRRVFPDPIDRSEDLQVLDHLTFTGPGQDSAQLIAPALQVLQSLNLPSQDDLFS